MDQDNFNNKIKELISKGGPEPRDYKELLELVDELKPEKIVDFQKAVSPILNLSTLIGCSFTKPFGYNGDFFIIEKIYQQYANPDPRYKKWDEFIHHLPVAIAVVNRKKLAIDCFIDLNRKANGEVKSVLILGSGPLTEVNEYLAQTPENTLKFDLIDMDHRAINFAKSKNRAFLNYLKFYNKNVIRFESEKKYDFIWSAGLFDYFKDKHFVYLVKKYYCLLEVSGEMTIGNFSINNPSKKVMEVLADWFLYHRSEEELIGFAKQAGISLEEISIKKEPLGINLFLFIKKSP